MIKQATRRPIKRKVAKKRATARKAVKKKGVDVSALIDAIGDSILLWYE